VILASILASILALEAYRAVPSIEEAKQLLAIATRGDILASLL
jgi:predicted transcriptional regulator